MNNAWRWAFMYALIAIVAAVRDRPEACGMLLVMATFCCLIGTLLGPEKPRP